MKEFVEKLIERLEEYFDTSGMDSGKKEVMRKIINQLAEEYLKSGNFTNDCEHYDNCKV